ncbi:MAG: ATPase [Desulfovibrio sp.]|uniref:ATPase n=1 Tax=Desulfovibrio sp. TaxID=885 RepID=UPI00258E5D42|nr:ATPase [Desulfovibrio sp.]MCD7983444.1 ATPase [Desulfovibrio sp.]
MSNSHQPNPSFSQTPSSDLAAIAVMLNEAAQAITEFSDSKLPPSKKAVAPTEGETRCYYLSPSMLKHERELFQRYRVDDFNGLIAEAHDLLAGLVKVMKSTHPDARLRGRSVSSLGSLLEQASSLLVRMRNLYEKVERIPS